MDKGEKNMKKFTNSFGRRTPEKVFLFIYSVMFISGIFFGSFTVCKRGEAEANVFGSIFGSFAAEAAHGKMQTVFATFMSLTAMFALLWLSAFFAGWIKTVANSLVFLYRGAAAGFTVSGAISRFSAKGLLLSLAEILPQYVILLPTALWLASVASAVDFSRLSLKSSATKFSKYFILLLVSLGAAAVISLIDGFVSGFLTEKIIMYIN